MSTQPEPNNPDNAPRGRVVRPVRLLRDVRAIADAGRLLAPGIGPVSVDLSAVAQVDAYGGALVAAALTGAIAGPVELVEPDDDDAHALIRDMLALAPSSAQWVGRHPRPRRDRRVLVPAWRVDDVDAARQLAHELMPVALPDLGVGEREVLTMSEAALVFAVNSLEHAEAPAMICAALDQPCRKLKLVAVDLGQRLAADPDALRAAVHHSRREGRELAGLATVSVRRGLEVTLRLATGAARMTFRDERWRAHSAAPVPGFVAGLEIHLAR